MERRHGRADGHRVEIAAADERQRLSRRLIVSDVLRDLLQVVYRLGKLNMIELGVVLKVHVADDKRFIGWNVSEQAQHALLALLELGQLRERPRQVRKVDQFRVDEDPLLRLVANG